MADMTCPLCHQPSTWEDNLWRPFCSERCQATDLGTWVAEHYRIPGPPITMNTSLSYSLERDGDTEEQQHN